MLQDLPNINIVSIRQKYYKDQTEEIAKMCTRLGFQQLRLGFFKPGFFKDPEKRLDESFYDQAATPIECRWSNFYYSRSEESEEMTFLRLVKSHEPYIFVHEDLKRGFVLDRTFFNPHLPIVYPSLNPRNFTVFDYRKVIENAAEVHMIESSFSVLADTFSENVKQRLFIHRYARPNANMYYQNMVGYQRNWRVINR
jgi:hypothetical protein